MNSTPTANLAPPRFETLNPMMVAGLVERHDCQSPAGIPDQWQRFSPISGTSNDRLGKVAYGVISNFDSDSNFDYLCGVEVSSASDLSTGLSSLQIAAQKYAVFTHRGHIAGIRATIATIWSKGIPESGCQVADGPTLERYGPEFNPVTGMGGVEIWIPVGA